MRYFIEDSKVGVAGPAVNVSVRFHTDMGQEARWLLNSMVTGIPCFYLFEEDQFDNFMDADEKAADDKWDAHIQEHHIQDFGGVPLTDDMQDILDYIKNNADDPAAQMINYIAALSELDEEKTDKLIENSVGKYVDEVEIPAF